MPRYSIAARALHCGSSSSSSSSSSSTTTEPHFHNTRASNFLGLAEAAANEVSQEERDRILCRHSEDDEDDVFQDEEEDEDDVFEEEAEDEEGDAGNRDEEEGDATGQAVDAIFRAHIVDKQDLPITSLRQNF